MRWWDKLRGVATEAPPLTMQQEAPASGTAPAPEALPAAEVTPELEPGPTVTSGPSVEQTPDIAAAPEAAPVPETPATPDSAPPESFWGKAWAFLNTPIPGTPSFRMEGEAVERLRERLTRTRGQLVDRVRDLFRGRAHVDGDTWDALEEILLESDLGPGLTEQAMDHLRAGLKAGTVTPDGLTRELAHFLAGRLGPARPWEPAPDRLNVVTLVGVNGAGKTTTLGKLARRLVLENRKVVVAAADTFRAAAVEQLAVWAARSDVPVIRHAEGGDAAAVVFDAVRAAKARDAGVLLVDTAGRLQNKANLMAELAKIGRVLDREAPEAVRETWLVLDATTGQNGLRQAEVFGQAVPLSGVVLTKLDGTAKGGVVFSIQSQLGIPVRLAGLGEGVTDLRDFDPGVFVSALFEDEQPREA
ncbi:MAG: signal recognition particle-docking protein FtsY [Candidatus Sericytochromatia bacterium]|nr:signal recognition particle-docking protein FtsY [Candidatus Sericytochromatia bacterium]